jgi:hypothetical protein
MADVPLEAARAQRLSLRRAMDETERAIVSAATGRPSEWAAGVKERLTGLQAAFDRHVTVTEGKDGLLEDVVADAPRLAHRVEVIRKDHVAIGEEVNDALGAVNDPQSFTSDDVETVTKTVLALLVHLVQHRHVGADLVYEAYTVDIDAAD